MLCAGLEEPVGDGRRGRLSEEEGVFSAAVGCRRKKSGEGPGGCLNFGILILGTQDVFWCGNREMVAWDGDISGVTWSLDGVGMETG